MEFWLLLLLLLLPSLAAYEKGRKAKLIPMFNVVQFTNDVCTASTTRSGTCYTSAECTNKGGTAAATCASGYGVCCVFTLSCGGTSSANCSYLVQTSITKTPSTNPCTYTICKHNSNVCKIRLDFTSFSIAGPLTGSAAELTTLTASTTNGGGIGDCITDNFSLSSPSSIGSPVICGFNTGQHMIVDASDSCNVANFDIGASSDTRSWDIKVTQYACGDEQGGPVGCLQYFQGSTGRVSSFNFPTTSTTVGATTTHLSNQLYSICFRQESGKCSICFTPSVSNTVGGVPEADTETTQSSFGLSVTKVATAPATSVIGTSCISDYLVIPNAIQISAGTTSPLSLSTTTSGSGNKICGRVFNAFTPLSTTAQQAGGSICTTSKPFRIVFRTDGDESTTGSGIAAITPDTNEQSLAPGGIIGFSLNFVQQTC